MLRALAIVVIVALTSPLAADDFDCKFDEAVARRLIAARTVAQLDAAYAKARRDDVPVRALYRSRRLQLHPTFDEEKRYLDSLPKRRDDLLCIYRLTYPGPIGESEAVTDTVYDMFERAAAIVKKRGLSYEQLLRMTLWTDGELAEIAWDWYQPALDADPKRVVAGIRRLTRKEQSQLCSGAIDGLSVAETAKLCRSEEY